VPEDIRRLKDSPDELPAPSTMPDTIPSFLLPPALREDMANATGGKSGGISLTGLGKPAEKPADTPAPVPTSPPPASQAKDERVRIADILTTDQRRVRSAAFTMALLDPAVRAELPNADQTIRITSLLADVGGMPAKMLVGELGLRLDQLAVLLICLNDSLGDENFQRAFGLPGDLDYVGKLIARAKAAGIDQHTALPGISSFVRSSFRKRG
jgi:hypothetical protein